MLDQTNLNVNSWGLMLLPYMDQQPLYNQFNCSVPAINEAVGLGFPAAVIAQNIAVISTPLQAFLCPSTPGGTSRIYNGFVPASGSLPPFNITWRAAASDYIAASGVRGQFANIAYAGNAGGDRDGVLQFSGSSRISDVLDGSSNTFMVGERVGGPTVYRRRAAYTLGQLDGSMGGGWGDFLNGEHWLSGSLGDGNPGVDGGPCPINCSNVRGWGFYSFHEGGTHVLMTDGSVRFINASINAYVFAGLITRKKGEVITDF
jgi:prepilin-type processing-associated H-X9-DG protein